MLEQKYLGQLNSDDADKDLEQDIRDCLNLVPQVGGRGSSPRRESLKGMVSEANSLPSGTNKTVGQFSDKNNDKVFFFNYNSSGNHSVDVKDVRDGNIYSVMESSLLNFTEETIIAGAGVVGDELIFTDGENPIRSIDFVKGINTFNNKDVKEWGFVVDLSTIEGASPVLSYTSLVGGNLNINLTTGVDKSTIDTWVSEIDASIYLNAERCGDAITITEATLGDVTSVTSTVMGVYASNHYITPLTEDEINFANIPPQCEPAISLGTDSTRKVNFINNKQYQFRVRYIYSDNTKSVLSPISSLIYSASSGDGSSGNNYVLVDFNEGNQYNINELTLVKNIEIYFREGNSGAWYLADTLNRGEYLNGEYKFYNEGSYSVIDDATSVKNFDSVPIKANTLATLKNRVFLAGTTEGYDTPCVDASIDVDIDDTNVNEETATWTIEGYIRIINNYVSYNQDFFAGQPVWKGGTNNFEMPVFGGWNGNDYVGGVDRYKQYLPQGGFTVYLDGTQYRATSKQIYKQDGTLSDLSTSPLTDGVYIADTLSDRQKIRDLADNGTNELPDLGDTQNIYQKFSIEGVKPGRYVLRVASHLCYEGDTPSYISDPSKKYQINNSLEWQQTSTNVRNFRYPIRPLENNKPTSYVSLSSNTPETNAYYELELELGDTGGVHDIAEDDNSCIAIADLSSPNPAPLLFQFTNAYASQFYTRDYIVSKRNEVNLSSSVEKASVEVKTYDALFPLVNLYPRAFFKTDHNGYAFYGNEKSSNVLNFPLATDVIRPRIYSGGHLLKDFDDSTLLGPPSGSDYNISSIYDGSAASGTGNEKDLNSNFRTEEFLVMSNTSDVENFGRTRVEGAVRDFDGNPLSGVLVTVAGTGGGRREVTDSNGEYSLLIFSNSDSTGTTTIREDNLFINASLSDYIIDEFPLGANRKVFLQVIINSLNYNNTTPFTVPTALLTVTSLLSNASHKRGGLYKWGIQYYDAYLRQSFVYTEVDFRKSIPYYTEDLSDVLPDKGYSSGTFKYGEPVITWEINSTPPSWATHWRWVRTKNLNYQSYLDWVANDVLYIKSTSVDDTTGDLDDDTTYSNGDSTQIAIGLGNLITYQEQNSDSKLGYTYTDGDRVILLKNNDSYFEEYIDLPVKGQQGNYIFIESLNSLPELLEGFEFQIYTPKKRTEIDTYYEISPCYKVTGGYHEGGTQDQTALLPAEGIFDIGDTYLVNREVPIGLSPSTSLVTKVFDSENVADSIDTRDISIGRAAFENVNAKQEFFFSTVRFSDELIQDSQINGIKTFEAFNEESLSNERGIIRKLVGTRDNLLAIHETESTSLYINEAIVNSPDGAGFLSQSDRVIADNKLLSGEFGTVNPESVVEYNDNIYWYDANKAEPIMYSLNGLEPLGSNRKMRNYFFGNEKIREQHLLSNPSDYSRVYGGYDPEKKMFILAFNTMGATSGDTIAFNDTYNYWSTRFSFSPEWFSYLGTGMYSFKAGTMWKHDEDDNNHNYFYGVHYPVSFSLVSNTNPFTEKIFRHVGIKSNKPFDIEFSNREGQFSDIEKVEMIQRDSAYYADILRNKNTAADTLGVGQVALLDGEVMRSEVMDIKFESDEEGSVYVDDAQVDFQESPGHNLGGKRG